MSAQGKKVIIFVEDLFDERELYYPYYRLKEAGAEVVLAGPEAGKQYKSKHGLAISSDAAARDLDLDQFAGLVIPGGYAPDIMRRDPAMVDVVRRMHQAGKPVATICHAGWMLCSAGILQGKKATSYHSIKDDMINAGAKWLDQEVVQDGNLITSRSPDDLPAFLKAILAAL